jgi:hypothetical protein
MELPFNVADIRDALVRAESVAKAMRKGGRDAH